MAVNFYKDNADLRWYMETGIDWAPIVSLTEYLGRAEGGFGDPKEAASFYAEVLELVGGFVAEEIAPHTAELDREGVRFENGEAIFPTRLAGIFKKIKRLELFGMTLPRELGGMNCPMLVYNLTSELIARGDVSVMGHFGFHGGMAMAMLLFSLNEGSTEFDVASAQITTTRWRDAIAEIRDGKAWGAMDITEPDAGSDMAALRAVGKQDADGNWAVSGQKVFITSGHAKYHFVIARTEKVADPDDPMSGLAGLSMFLVPAFTQDKAGKRVRAVTIDRLEEKIGHHASATASLTFEDAPAELVGQRGQGFKHMLTLMNNARLGVGFESLGLCESALRLAKAYAAERRSMGKSIDQHEMIADYLDQMETEIRGIRALAMYGAVNEELGQKTSMMLKLGLLVDDLEVARHKAALKGYRAAARRVTPLLKYLAAEKAVEMGRRCIQIHGGNGYTRDFGAEKLLRDALVMPIYEGTSQIQALMAMKDTLGGVLKDPSGFIKRTAQVHWRSVSARDPLERRVARVSALSAGALQHLMAKTVGQKYRSLQGRPLTEWPARFLKSWDPKKDFGWAMLHAERLTCLLADEAICELLLAQAQAHPERRELLERYLDRAEPRCRLWADEIQHTGHGVMRRLGKLERARRVGEVG